MTIVFDQVKDSVFLVDDRPTADWSACPPAQVQEPPA